MKDLETLRRQLSEMAKETKQDDLKRELENLIQQIINHRDYCPF
jgi:hypothetical protein